MNRRNPAVERWFVLLAITVLQAWPGPAASAAVEQTQEPQSRLWRSIQDIKRDIPKPGDEHPGNVFLLGEALSVKLPPGFSARTSQWRALDDRGQTVAKGTVARGASSIAAGKLGIGWYRVEFLDDAAKAAAWTTAAVLAPLAEPVPQDSPICVDSATAWFARGNSAKQERLAQLAALAGVNWIRDRLRWGHVQPAEDRFSDDPSYESSASLQAQYGLKLLQVFHDSPGWAVQRGFDGPGAAGRFPRDLRVLYRFCKTMAQTYTGRVLAWEPWNEANITVFGGHTIDEMTTHQKAAYLAFKAAQPNLTVCWNVYAGSGTPLHTQGVLKNQAWPYFETYNIHTYSKPENYLNEFAPARDAACGRPIWITECGIPLPSKTERPWGELSREDELKQARFIAPSYASSLFAGVNRHFFFILGNYVERKIQFGLLRNDQTPRPGYVALAAVGRFLAGAESLGRWLPSKSPSVKLYAFRSRPDGRPRDVLVVWADSPAKWTPPGTIAIEAVHDYLGRPLGKAAPDTIDPSPLFVVLPPGDADKLPLETPRHSSAYRHGTASPVILQLQMPLAATNLNQQAHTIDLHQDNELDLFVYNFADKTAAGAIEVQSAPDGCEFTPDRWQVSIEPMERKALPCRLKTPAGGRDLAKGQWFEMRGDFGPAGRPVLAVRLVVPAEQLTTEKKLVINSAANPERWQNNITAGAQMTRRKGESGQVVFEMHFGRADPWAYPKLPLQKREIPNGTYDALTLTVTMLEGSGDVRVQFVEENGASYIADTLVRSDTAQPQKVVVRFDQARSAQWAPPDPDGALQPENVRTLMVGINAQRQAAVKMAVADMAWGRF